MFKKNMLILGIAIFFCSSLALSLKAQNYPQGQSLAPKPSERLDKIEANLDQLSSLSAANHKEIMQKLDLILKNQAEIQNQIYKIKVRASR